MPQYRFSPYVDCIENHPEDFMVLITKRPQRLSDSQSIRHQSGQALATSFPAINLADNKIFLVIAKSWVYIPVHGLNNQKSWKVGWRRSNGSSVDRVDVSQGEILGLTRRLLTLIQVFN